MQLSSVLGRRTEPRYNGGGKNSVCPASTILPPAPAILIVARQLPVNYSISTLCVRSQLRSNSSNKSLSVLEARLRERFCLFSSLSTAS